MAIQDQDLDSNALCAGKETCIPESPLPVKVLEKVANSIFTIMVVYKQVVHGLGKFEIEMHLKSKELRRSKSNKPFTLSNIL